MHRASTASLEDDYMLPGDSTLLSQAKQHAREHSLCRQETLDSHTILDFFSFQRLIN